MFKQDDNTGRKGHKELKWQNPLRRQCGIWVQYCICIIKTQSPVRESGRALMRSSLWLALSFAGWCTQSLWALSWHLSNCKGFAKRLTKLKFQAHSFPCMYPFQCPGGNILFATLYTFYESLFFPTILKKCSGFTNSGALPLQGTDG